MDILNILSNGSGKMEGIQSINTNPIGNSFCDKMRKNPENVCSFCYSAQMLQTFRQSCVPKYDRNGQILSESVLPLNLLPTIGSALVRISSHGELINDIHVVNIMNIVKKNPHVTFTIFTKRLNLLKAYFAENEKPDNFIVIFSNNQFNKPVTASKMQERFPFVDKVFNVVTPESGLNDRINCVGSCLECRKCYTKGESTGELYEAVKLKTKAQKVRIANFEVAATVK